MVAGADVPRSYVNIHPGDPAPWFWQRSSGNPRYAFDTAGGRYVVLCFFGSSADGTGAKALRAIEAHRRLFDDVRLSIYGVSTDPADEAGAQVRQSLPGIRHFWDADCKVSRLFGSAPREAGSGAAVLFRLFWIVLDPTLRVLATFPLDQDAAVFAYLAALPPPASFSGMESSAPVVVLPNVFEPALCRRLIETYERAGGEESGFMREVDGKTVLMHDRHHKIRRDHILDDPDMIGLLRRRIQRRVLPEIKKVFQFEATRMERYIVSCYAAEDGGHFSPHRDNTTSGTAHRRFAVSLNLNADFKGGEVGFPEYGPRGFKAPLGGAVVFSCSLLHAVSRVTAGRRYAFLPFLYDEAAARSRAANAESIIDPK